MVLQRVNTRLVIVCAKVHRALALTPTPIMLQSIVWVTLLGAELELLRNISVKGPCLGTLGSVYADIVDVFSDLRWLLRVVLYILDRTLCSSLGWSPIIFGPHVLRMPLKAKVVTQWLRLLRLSCLVMCMLLAGAEHSPLPTLVERLLLLLLIVLTLTLNIARVWMDPLSSLVVTLRPLLSGIAELLYTRDRNAGLLLCPIRLVLRVSSGWI